MVRKLPIILALIFTVAAVALLIAGETLVSAKGSIDEATDGAAFDHIMYWYHVGNQLATLAVCAGISAVALWLAALAARLKRWHRSGAGALMKRAAQNRGL